MSKNVDLIEGSRINPGLYGGFSPVSTGQN